MDEAPKVVSLRGDAFTCPGEPIPGVVEELERLLEMAKSGELQGLAAAYLHADGCTSISRSGIQGRGLIGALEILKLDMCEALRK